MAIVFSCPYLNGTVELTEEREQHITETHPGTLPTYRNQIAATLADPDQVRRSTRDERARLFVKWFASIRTGRYMVVVTVTDLDLMRHWIVTAYTARKLAGGEIEWSKS
jgi:hypothetical protein